MKEYEIKQGATTVIVPAESSEEAVKLALEEGLIQPNLALRVMGLFGASTTSNIEAHESTKPVGYGSEAP